MDELSSRARMYLAKLNTMSGGDPEVQISMYEVGEVLGMDTAEAGKMAETLFVSGYAELKTLSGGIGITAMGLGELGASLPEPGAGVRKEVLGDNPVLKGAFLETATRVLADLKTALPEGRLSYEQLDEALIDIKTMEVQLLSPRPKTEVIREIFRSLAQAVAVTALSEIKARLDHLVSNR